ncbi:MAG: site-specific integrase, partial [Acidobacteriaceae bacterium]
MRWRRPPLQHPLAHAFAHAVDSLCTALTPSSKRNYNIVVRGFLVYLGTEYPKVTRLGQLRRDPHILGWMAHLRAQNPTLATATCVGRLFALRTLFHELARTHHLPELAHLLLREDIPRSPHTLPRPLTAEQDQLLQQEFMRRNDLGGNVFLLLRYTGMRIGECVDLSYDCLRSTGPNQWAIHVPLGKLKTERMVPVDAFGRDLVHRLRFFRCLDPLAADGRLLARPGSKVAVLVQLRDYLHQVCHSLGLPTAIVPHQFRHTYATEMLRSGVSFPIMMKLLGHVDPGMTMRYVDVALTDLEREFQLARSKPSHLAPHPKTSTAPVRTGIDGLIDSLVAAQHVMEMFRRSLPDGN